MNNEEPIEVEEVTPQESGPGELLAQKREALGLGIQQVAEELHITMHYVRALESNAYDKLPGDVFIRGYIRSYANLLKLDPVELIEVYNEYTNQRENAFEANITQARRRKNRNVPWIIISGIAFIVIAIALWYFSSGDDNAKTSARSSGQLSGNTASVVLAPSRNGAVTTIDNVAINLPTDPVTAAAAVGEGESIVGLATGDPEVLPPQTPGEQALLASEQNVSDSTPINALANDAVDEIASPISSSTPSATPASAPVPESIAPNATDSADAPSDTVNDVDDDAARSVTAPTTATQPANVLGTFRRMITVDAGGDDVVQISFKGESWVQIDDRNDKQVYSDVRVAGDVLRLSGSAPFDILLGDASSAEMSLNGNNVDFSSNIRTDNSARLTIGL